MNTCGHHEETRIGKSFDHGMALSRPLLFLFLAVALGFHTVRAQQGSPDLAFNPADVGFGFGDPANKVIITSAVQPDGKIVIGGDFTSYNGTARNRVARLNPDGTLDMSFDPGVGANSFLEAIAVQADGKVLIGGNFTNYAGTPLKGIARLNADGTVDNTFFQGAGAQFGVRAIAVQSDGKILVGGNFTTFHGTSINRIARLNTDGTLDNAFSPGSGPNSYIDALAVQSDGKIIIAGGFTIYNGVGISRLARLNADGTLDNTFSPGTGPSGVPSVVKLQADGKILIGGFFYTYNGVSRAHFARINTDGSLDNTMSGTGPNSTVNAIGVQPDGKILVGGRFGFFNGTFVNKIIRLNLDGTPDNTFDPGQGADETVRSVEIKPNGQIAIMGDFFSYDGAGRRHFALLNADGSLDHTIDPGTGANNTVNSMRLLPNGQLVIAGSFTSYAGTPIRAIARLNTDGTLDNSFNPGTGPRGSFNSYGYLNAVVAQ
ncbi:MAG: delta-60 repeat domain-containing protein, partial [Cyclobacteriaceae bacterium]|nr:delta-60 repeat domain-containing protein [Cyclobacteriaceae bacterium]